MTILLGLILIPLTLLTLALAVELFTGIRPLPETPSHRTGAVPAVIVVPAHDEAMVLQQMLAVLKEETAANIRILVVADNCLDATAKIARFCGVEVIERFDADRRGKGFALDYAKQHLRSQPPRVVVVMDADCLAAPGALKDLIGTCVATGRPSQAAYLQKPVRDGSPMLQLSTFAFFIKNVVRQRALQRIAGRVHLLGTGMALPWALFDKATLATGNIVEDLEIGLGLAAEGHPAVLVEGAAVWSDAAGERSTITQRRRWEGGYLDSAGKWAPTLLVQGLRRGSFRQVWAAISLFIPPLALLISLDLIALLAAALTYSLTGRGLMSLILLVGALILASIAIMAAWAMGGARFISLRGLAQIPLYLLWKLPLYLGLARRGAPREWMRTDRG